MLLKWVSIKIKVENRKTKDQKTRKNINPDKNFFALNNTHYNDIKYPLQ